MRIKMLIAISASCIFLAACATPYQSQSYMGGFSETQLAEDAFRVTFKGNAYTGADRAVDYTLLRSAELTLQHGYRYFVIVDSDAWTDVSTYTTPTQTHTTASVYGTGNYATGSATSTTTGGQTYVYNKPRTSNTIVCFREKPVVGGIVYDAEFISRSIKAKHGISAN